MKSLLTLLVMFAVASALPAQGGPAPVTFTDGEFLSWRQATIGDPGASGLATASVSGGNPGRALQCAITVGNPDGLILCAINDAVVWDPGVDGPIESFTASWEVDHVGGGEQLSGLVIEQAGRLYFANGNFRGMPSAPSWARATIAGSWKEVGFRFAGQQTTCCASGPATPPLDLSGEGTPVRFGIWTYNANVSSGPATTTYRHDNWSLTIQPARFAGTDALWTQLGVNGAVARPDGLALATWGDQLTIEVIPSRPARLAGLPLTLAFDIVAAPPTGPLLPIGDGGLWIQPRYLIFDGTTCVSPLCLQVLLDAGGNALSVLMPPGTGTATIGFQAAVTGAGLTAGFALSNAVFLDLR